MRLMGGLRTMLVFQGLFPIPGPQLRTLRLNSIHLLALLFVLAGCRAHGPTTSDPAAPLVLDEDRPFLDVPIPVGLQRRLGKGLLRLRDRMAILVYRGPFTREQLEEFFDRTLPISSWRRVRNVAVGEEVRRIYARRGELLVLIDRPVAGGTELVTELNIYNER